MKKLIFNLVLLGLLAFSCKKPSTNNSNTTTKRTYYIDYDLDGTKVRYEDTVNSAYQIIHSVQNDYLDLPSGITMPWENLQSIIGIVPFGANRFGFPKFYLRFRIGNFSKIKLNEKIYNDTLTVKNINQQFSKTILSIYKKLSPITPTIIGTWIDTSALNYEAGYLNGGITVNGKSGNWSPSLKNAYIIVNKIEKINNVQIITGEIGGSFRKYKQFESKLFPGRLENKFLSNVKVSIKFSLPYVIIN